jgi:hypothetical protein
MMSLEQFLQGFLDQEAALVRQWGAMDPAYADNSWELRTSAVAKKKDLGGAIAWERLRLPVSVTNAPLAAPNPDAAAQGERCLRRNILRVDTYQVPGIGHVEAFITSHGDATAPNDDSRPALRFSVANLDGQARILRADSPCTSCWSTGGGSGQGCGFVDEAGAECDYGWLSRGGAALGLGRPDSQDRRLKPVDSRWHAWFDG